MRTALLPMLALTTVFAQTAETESEAALLRMREFGRNYAAQLKNFSCNKRIVRQASRPGKKNDWSDASEEEIDYVDRGERRRMISIGGKPVKSEARTKHSFGVAGEFGMLGKVFAESVKAEFTWVGRDGANCMFRYRIARQNSTLILRMGKEQSVLGYHGTVTSNCADGAVTYLEAVSDPDEEGPSDFSTAIRFAPATIAEKQFQLPESAINSIRFGKQTVRSEVRFSGYRKYDASSQIRFE